MSDEAPPDLAGLAYMFYYVADPATFTGLDDADRAALEHQYSPAQILGFYDALEWALAHPDFKFTSVMPALQGEPGFEDKALLEYFKKLHTTMKPIADKLRP
jgi:hypothetical protein